ncbi:MAG: YitT family protein [Bacilli bacterium]|nr:YitT family protein [Bacilli bacterium]
MDIVNKNVSKLLNEIHKKNFGRNIFLFAMGLLISAIAINLFFVPYQVIPTGSSGLAYIISYISGIDLSLITFFISLILLILGFIFFGWDYALKMIAITVLSPCFLKATTLITRFIDLENTSLFLIMIIGGAMLGLSTGLVRKSGFNTGGFGVLSDIFKKYFYLSIGTSGLIINAILITVSAFIFGLNSAIYAIISLLASSYVVDRVLIGISHNKVFYIVTDNPLEIREYVMDELHYSVTLVKARGGYSNKKKKMLMCVVPTIEYLKLKELVLAIDSKAFFLIVDIYDSSVRKICKNM